jgi:HJR/Mrr/RecB family endonuclease
MALKRISESEFNDYNFRKEPNLIGMVREEHWFSDDDAHILGTVLLDNFDKDWSIVIMALEDDGVYRFVDAQVDISQEDKAISALIAKMKDFSKAGKIENDLYKLEDELNQSTLFDLKASVIITDINDEIKKFFKKYPHKLYEINPRKFEELIASIFEDLGFDVKLTQATRDGGRDIIASLRNAVANFLTYVECKRYAPDNKIDVSIIRQVQGIHYTHKPSKSIIVTTSFFTKDAIKEANFIENQLELKDFNNIKQWLQSY